MCIEERIPIPINKSWKTSPKRPRIIGLSETIVKQRKQITLPYDALMLIYEKVARIIGIYQCWLLALSGNNQTKPRHPFKKTKTSMHNKLPF